MGKRIDSSQRGKKSQTFPLRLFFLYHSLLPVSFVLCQKQLGLTLQSCHIKAIPCTSQKGEFCSWMERQSSQTPSHRLHTWGVKADGKKKRKKKRLFLFEPEFEPWGQTHYSTMKEVFHAITEQIDMDEMLAVVEDLNSNVSSFVKKEKKKNYENSKHFSPHLWHRDMMAISRTQDTRIPRFNKQLWTYMKLQHDHNPAP